MKQYFLFFPLLISLGFSSCSQPEAEMEPDYDNMVLLDEPNEWMLEEEKDRKVVVLDKPDPQELILIEPMDPALPR